MSVLIQTEESEIDFKEPLASEGESRRRLSSPTGTSLYQFPANALPPINVKPTFGLMGSWGAVISTATFLTNIISDVILAFSLRKQYRERAYDYYDRDNNNYPFTVTLMLIVIPLIYINAVSQIWYLQHNRVMGDTAIFYRKSLLGKIICVVLHILLLGPLVRYYDTAYYGRRTCRSVVEVDLGGQRGSVQHLTPVGESTSVLQQEMSRETALVDMQNSFFKDVPQTIFQLVLLSRMYYATAGNWSSYYWTLLSQIVKIIVAIFSASWSIVSYQDEIRRQVPGKIQLSCSAIIVCLLWRAGTISARVISIALFTSLKVDEEGGLVKSQYHQSFISFPLIMAFIILAHWGFMIVWIYSQKTNFCSREEGIPQPCFEFMYDLLISWVHIFDYVNTKDSPSRRRMALWYFIILAENTTFILIWHLQFLTPEIWIRALVIFGDECFFIIGICSAIGYYSFLHPDKTKVRQINATWRR